MSSSEAQNFLGWDWQESSMRWLDEVVSSEVCHLPLEIKVSRRTKVSHVERVTGLLSQFPIPLEAIAFLINVTNIPDCDPELTVDNLLKEQARFPSCYNQFSTEEFGRTSTPGPDPPAADPKLTSTSPAFYLHVLTQNNASPAARRALDPNSNERLIEAQFRAREIQDSSRTGQVLSFIESISDWRCGVVDSVTSRVYSGGKAVPKKLAQRCRNKNHILTCSLRDDLMSNRPSHFENPGPDRRGAFFEGGEW
ncbi:hypothetical protein B0H13DRAFT_1856331 [Mycena leptocephala]|nr:hypothetical protein B0H13DRAFT_1856331 [Mycena leptocephala]